VTSHRSDRIMTGMFRDRDAAERAYGCLAGRGYHAKDVSLLMSDKTRARCFPADARVTTELGSKAAEGAGVGAVAGGGLGALLAGLAAAGIAVPLLPIIAIGPLAAAIAGGATGGVAGAIVGALVGSGIPEERAKIYDRGINEGGIVLGVTPRTDEDAAYIEREWRDAPGEQIYWPAHEEAGRRR
jgi:hypothetical protein